MFQISSFSRKQLLGSSDVLSASVSRPSPTNTALPGPGPSIGSDLVSASPRQESGLLEGQTLTSSRVRINGIGESETAPYSWTIFSLYESLMRESLAYGIFCSLRIGYISMALKYS